MHLYMTNGGQSPATVYNSEHVERVNKLLSLLLSIQRASCRLSFSRRMFHLQRSVPRARLAPAMLRVEQRILTGAAVSLQMAHGAGTCAATAAASMALTQITFPRTARRFRLPEDVLHRGGRDAAGWRSQSGGGDHGRDARTPPSCKRVLSALKYLR